MADKSKSTGFSDFEREAMKQRAKELRDQAKSTRKREDGEKEITDAIAAMPADEKVIAKRLHEVISKAAPSLMPKTWYGMPAYAKNDKVVVYFQGRTKFESRYFSVGFNDTANLDTGNMWPVVFALVKLTESEEKQIAELVKKAVSE